MDSPGSGDAEAYDADSPGSGDAEAYDAGVCAAALPESWPRSAAACDSLWPLSNCTDARFIGGTGEPVTICFGVLLAPARTGTARPDSKARSVRYPSVSDDATENDTGPP
jgi:hypothetical protein